MVTTAEAGLSNPEFVDIHSHFLFAVDDGAPRIETSIAMLEQAAELGFRHLVATPHVTEAMTEEIGHRFQTHFERLIKEKDACGFSLDISLASELYYYEKSEKWLDYPWAFIDPNRKYFLFELPLFDSPLAVEEFIFRCRLKSLVPILAHPERYRYLHHSPEMLANWYRQGCLMQCNAGSIAGQFGREVSDFTRKLLRTGIFHFVASDAHDPDYRDYRVLMEAFRVSGDWIEEDYRRQLFVENPLKTISGQTLEQPALREDFQRSSRWINWLRKLKFIRE